ncbi:MAG: glycosyltransferase [Flavobacteriales bacterium]|nr:glycosyltransferase [Flavobacteriales bacterium]
MKKRVAIYLAGVKDISGGGGAERFFADFFEKYGHYKKAKFEVYFFCDKSTYVALRKVNKLPRLMKNVVLLWNISNRFKTQIENLDFSRKLKKFNIDIVHCANFGAYDFDRLYHIAQKRKNNSPKLILNVVDCQVPHVLEDKNSNLLKNYRTRYIDLPNKIGFDGVYSWYELFLNYFKEKKHYQENTVFGNIQSRFADTSKFKPASQKKNTIAFASRLHRQKRPDWFLKAIKELYDRKVTELDHWKFLLIGGGELKEEMSQFITNNNLAGVVEMSECGDLSTIYPETSCYVSTQDFENFPSLSMMEAMACGNAVIARNVGQTNLMVKNGVNGLVLKEDSYQGLTNTLEEYIIMSSDDRKQMQQNSIRLVEEVHTEKNFFRQIELFWNQVIQK